MSFLERQQIGLVVVDHGSRKQESNLRLLEFVELYRQATDYLTVEPAHMELAAPTILDAFKACVSKGALQVIVSPFFLLPGRHWQNDIPRLAKEAAEECNGVPYLVAAPIGVHQKLIEIMESRIEFCSAARGDEVCGSCTQDNNCRTNSNWTNS